MALPAEKSGRLFLELKIRLPILNTYLAHGGKYGLARIIRGSIVILGIRQCIASAQREGVFERAQRAAVRATDHSADHH
jgi:hypothetical protein